MALAFSTMMLMSSLSGCIMDGWWPENRPDALTGPEVEVKVASLEDGAPTNGHPTWNATVEILKVSIGEGPKADLGPLLIRRSNEIEWTSVPILPSEPSQGSGPRAWYAGPNGSLQRPVPGDTVRIAGLDRSYQGAEVSFAPSDPGMTSVSLPAAFGDGVAIALDEPSVSIGQAPAGTVDVWVRVINATPSVERIPWGLFHVVLDASGGAPELDLGVPLHYIGAGRGQIPRDSPHVYYYSDPDHDVRWGDSFEVTSLPRDLAGRTMSLCLGTGAVGSVALPPAFQDISSYLDLTIWIVPLVNNGKQLSEFHIRVDDFGPMLDGTRWEDVTLQLMHPTLGKVGSPINASGWTWEPTGTRLIEASTQDGVMSVWEEIVLVMDRGFEGYDVAISDGNGTIGSAHLPAAFHPDYLELDLGDATVRERRAGYDTVWDLYLTVLGTYPPLHREEWANCTAHVIGFDNGTELMAIEEVVEFEGTNATEPNILYRDVDGDGLVGCGDVMMVQAMNMSFMDQLLEVVLDYRVAVRARIPGEFPRNVTNVTVNLSSGVVNSWPINGTPWWDVVYNVDRVTPDTAHVPWADLELRIVLSSGVELGVFNLSADPLHQQDNKSAYGANLSAWYVEVSGNDYINAGDAIRITGLYADCTAATIFLLREGVVVAAATLPREFP